MATESGEEVSGLTLYQFWSCPYCARVRAALDRLGIEVASRDVLDDPGHMRELIEATGSRQVPVLRIEDAGGTRWMPESADIVRYLEQRFAA